uniref:Uncharacterized protein n=1 Tax=Arundo donax TaxID=35708 RepID=A0A0A9EZ57_ARUDO
MEPITFKEISFHLFCLTAELVNKDIVTLEVKITAKSNAEKIGILKLLSRVPLPAN